MKSESSENMTNNIVVIGHKLNNVNDNITWLCTGVRIAENFVLTTADCASTKEATRYEWTKKKLKPIHSFILIYINRPNIVRSGDLNTAAGFEASFSIDIRSNDMETFDYPIKKIIKHPQYKQNAPLNNVALLKVSVNIEDNFRPPCLWLHTTMPSKSVNLKEYYSDMTEEELPFIKEFDSKLSSTDCNEVNKRILDVPTYDLCATHEAVEQNEQCNVSFWLGV